jgi:inorganic pyrophosphatase
VWSAGLLLLLPLCSDVPRRPIVGGAPVAPAAFALDEDTVAGRRHFARGYPAQDGRAVNAVIEIPSGTTGKFEVDAADGWLHWQRDRVHGGRREIDYLPFPVNYGMVPRTLAEDGDGLDIVVLGRGLERGLVARTRVIGVLKMGEPTERDDKLLAVPVEPALVNGFSRLRDLPELDAHYPAARDILVLWFSHYWGEGATHVLGWGDAAEAAEILERARRAFTRTPRARSTPPDAAGPHLRAPLPFVARDRSPPPRLGPSGCGSACSAP